MITPKATILVVFFLAAMLCLHQVQAETCRNTDCHAHNAQNSCNHDERMAKWHYCWGIAEVHYSIEMPVFNIDELAPILLEKVMAKLDWKSYFRLQRTSKDMKKIIRSCQKIAIRMGGCCLPCKETGHLLCYSEQLQLIDTEDLWGTRLQRLSLEREHTNLIGQCCESLKKSRITFEELSMSYLPLTKESYVKVLEIVKPEKIGMTDATVRFPYAALVNKPGLTEGEFMVGPDPDGALFMLTALLPEFQVYTGSLHRVNYDIEQVYDYLCIILQFLRDHALPRLRKFYFMITLRDVQPELSANELLDKFRDFKPVVNKMNGISTIECMLNPRRPTCMIEARRTCCVIQYDPVP